MNIDPEINAWLILGATVIIGAIGFLIRKVFFNEKDNNYVTQNQTGGNDAEMYQSGGDMTITKKDKK